MTGRKTYLALVGAAILGPALVYAGCGSCGAGAKESCGAKRKASCSAKKSCPSGECAKSESHKSASHGAHDAEAAEISTAALQTLLRAGNPVVLDARSGKYDDGKRIPGAQSLSPDASAKEAAKKIPAKDALVVTYCSNTQCPASSILAKRLRKLGYNNILEYPAGIAGWQEQGNNVEEVKL